MITLHLGLGNGDVQQLDFENKEELIKYVENLRQFKVVWIVTGGTEFSEIYIGENIDIIKYLIKSDVFYYPNRMKEIHIHEYETFEMAYKVAYDMREGHPRRS